MRLHFDTVLITGGTSGIGRALAEQFHERGNRVIITGRRQHLIDEITELHPGMEGIAVDLDEAGAGTTLAAFVRDHAPDLNVLINNAGISREEDLTAGDLDGRIARSIVQTNILATLDVTGRWFR